VPVEEDKVITNQTHNTGSSYQAYMDAKNAKYLYTNRNSQGDNPNQLKACGHKTDIIMRKMQQHTVRK